MRRLQLASQALVSEITVETSLAPGTAVEQRLQRLSDLRDKSLNSQTECEARRQQILAES